VDRKGNHISCVYKACWVLLILFRLSCVRCAPGGRGPVGRGKLDRGGDGDRDTAAAQLLRLRRLQLLLRKLPLRGSAPQLLSDRHPLVPPPHDRRHTPQARRILKEVHETGCVSAFCATSVVLSGFVPQIRGSNWLCEVICVCVRLWCLWLSPIVDPCWGARPMPQALNVLIGQARFPCVPYFLGVSSSSWALSRQHQPSSARRCSQPPDGRAP